VELGDAAVKFDLQLATEEAGGRLLASLRYNTDLFDAATARALLGELEALLAHAAAAPATPLSELRRRLRDHAAARRGEHDAALRESLRGARRKAVSLST
jgi:non-ribosomal peptide synthetase component F